MQIEEEDKAKEAEPNSLFSSQLFEYDIALPFSTTTIQYVSSVSSSSSRRNGVSLVWDPIDNLWPARD